MSIGNWGLANPAGLWFGLIGLFILALHILKPRRTQATVASTFLWRELASPVSAARPWQKLIPSWLLAAQLLTALLLALAIAKPVRLTDNIVAEHTILVIDTSASMAATDASPNRLNEAVERAREIVAETSDGNEVSLVISGPPARSLVSRTTSLSDVGDALDAITTSAGRSDVAGAFAIATGLNLGDKPSQTIFLSDGQIDLGDIRAAPPGTRFESIGRADTNRGISAISTEPNGDGLTVRFTVRSYGGPEATQSVRVDVDGKTQWDEMVTISAGGAQSITADVPAGERVEVFLAADDLLSGDNRAMSVARRKPNLTVGWVGEPNLFLEGALTSLPQVTYQRFESWQALTDSKLIPNVVISDRVSIPASPNWPTFAIATKDFSPSSSSQRPAITYVDAESPVLTGIDPSEIRIALAEASTLPDDARLYLGAEGVPLLFAAEIDGVSVIYQSFALADSTLPLSPGFPLLLDRIVTELSGVAVRPSELTVGSSIRVDPRLETRITYPDGTSASLAPGSGAISADRVGFWVIEQDGSNAKLVAVNPDPAESTILPLAELAIAEPYEAEIAETAPGQVSLIPWVAALLLGLLGIEFLLARAKRGVGEQQWRVSVGLRLAIAGLLIAVLVTPTLGRDSDQIATVFALDASDSMGLAGRSETEGFVRDAISAMPDDAASSVVVFGAEARLASFLSDNPTFAGVNAIVDPSATDLSAALRLAAAVLPSDSRRRIVVISDGVPTVGDHNEEVVRLAAQGIPVDTVLIAPNRFGDVAVTDVSLPGLASVGELVTIDVTVTASTAGPARVRLYSDGEIIEEVTVDLPVGDSHIAFEDTLADTSVARYSAEVIRSDDTVTANDVGYASIPILGSTRILIVDADASAPAIESALEASGIEFDVITPASIPPVDELASYVSVVLANVDRFELSDAQVATLDSYVRDLGRGMVVIGGDRSYPLGGYLNSDLEDLLPVVSEITDKLRRQSVAEVLAIDTSGSMGACHCADNGFGDRDLTVEDNGGVNKTTIARTAAAQAIAALDATDEVGVLSVNASAQWVIDLQANPSPETIADGLDKINPEGPTNLRGTLNVAAEQLEESNASLKHIIFFSDGFTEPGHLAALAVEAAELYDRGITVSVVATGEGAAQEMEAIAEAGGGRFYPGRSLEQIPKLIVDEAVLASRSFVNEGEFLPLITSDSATVRTLSAAPIIKGFIATTPKDTARVDLRIGDENDPLLASWRVGLGRVTSWTSDSGERWASDWAAWDGNASFWAGVIRETFPASTDGGTVSATVVGDQLVIEVEGSETWGDSSQGTARVTNPDGTSVEVVLDRVSGTTFVGSAPAIQAGNYAVGGVIGSGGETEWAGIGLANRSYSPEYDPIVRSPEVLTSTASLTGGSVGIEPAQSFRLDGTVSGKVIWRLAPWLLFLATLLWPLAVALSRLSWRSGPLAIGRRRIATAASTLLASRPTVEEATKRPDTRKSRVAKPVPAGTSKEPATPGEPVEAKLISKTPAPNDEPESDSSSLNQLLANKKKRRP